MQVSKELQAKYDKAKVGLMHEKGSVFLSTILFSLNHQWTDKLPAGQPAGTDGANLYLNPEVVGDYTKDQLMTLMAHGAWRVAFQHMSRMGTKDTKTFSEAGAHVVNVMLKDDGFDLPDTKYGEDRFRDTSAEEVYKILMEEAEDQDPDKGQGQGQGGAGGEGEPDPFGSYVLEPGEGEGEATQQSASQKKAAENAVEDIVARAATQSRMAKESGKLPGEIEKYLDELFNPKLDWKTLLQNYMNAFKKDDYSFRKPNRKFFPEYFLPSAHSESIGEIAFAVDTSGSVSDEEFKAFLTEMNSVKESLDPEFMSVVDFDTRINNVTRLTRDQTVHDIKFTGGGGTDLHPVFEHYEKKPPIVLIVFSDLYCSVIEKDPGYPVLWIVVNNPGAHVNFGTTIDYDTTNL